jgi:hypothetical protein
MPDLVGRLSRSSVKVEKSSPLAEAAGVPGVALALDLIDADIWCLRKEALPGVTSSPDLADEVDDILDGDGVYEALSALSVPSLIPNLDVASLWAAGLMVATRSVRFTLGVRMLDRAFWMAFPFLSR